MAERAFGSGTYVGICIVLVLLTLLTVGVSFVNLPIVWHLTAGLTIGAAKAALVVLFFMHALRSGRVTWMVIAVTLLWVVVLFALTLADYLSRGQVPHMPGH
jgi:cytochrome c oxidase subunit 4